MISLPSTQETFEILCLQAAGGGRAEALFGKSLSRVRSIVPDYLGENTFPDIYFEFPLKGEPFLDVTMLYAHNMHLPPKADNSLKVLFDWYQQACGPFTGTAFGVEIDASRPAGTAPGIHFQLRSHLELVTPFCTLAGEPKRAALYLDLARRMPPAWPLSFFGLFRGRPDTPLRVCGYLGKDEITACGKDPGRVVSVFEKIGFNAFDEDMLRKILELMHLGLIMDFQFDIYPDGSLGDVFSLDIALGEQRSSEIIESFRCGSAAKLMTLLKCWEIADERTGMIPECAISRALPAVDSKDRCVMLLLMLRPHWIKVRWRNGRLQAAKCYCLLKAKVNDS